MILRKEDLVKRKYSRYKNFALRIVKPNERKRVETNGDECGWEVAGLIKMTEVETKDNRSESP